MLEAAIAWRRVDGECVYILQSCDLGAFLFSTIDPSSKVFASDFSVMFAHAKTCVQAVIHLQRDQSRLPDDAKIAKMPCQPCQLECRQAVENRWAPGYTKSTKRRKL